MTPRTATPLAAALVIAASLLPAAPAGAAIITVFGDQTNTTTPLGSQGTEASQLTALTNDGFAYNPASPTSPLPGDYTGPGTGFHGDSTVSEVIAMRSLGSAFDFTNAFLDLYGRRGCCQDRDNNFSVQFYNNGVLQETVSGLTIPDNANAYLRVTPSASLVADTFRIVDNAGAANFFTLAELRLNGDPVGRQRIKLTGDEANTTTPNASQGTETNQLAALSNDGFAYDFDNPTTPRAGDYTGPNTGFHGTDTVSDVIALSFNQDFGSIVVDLYGRQSFFDRDNNFSVVFYLDGIVQQTISGLAIPDNSTAFLRVTALASTVADAIRIVDNAGVGNFFTLAEIRASGIVIPSPAALPAGLALLGLAAARRRR